MHGKVPANVVRAAKEELKKSADVLRRRATGTQVVAVVSIIVTGGACMCLLLCLCVFIFLL